MDRSQLLEAALDSIPEGIALLGEEGEVVFWNRAAEAITGYASTELLTRAIPGTLEPLLLDEGQSESTQPDAKLRLGRGAMVHAHHKLGHDFQAITRIHVLRDGMGERFALFVIFHPAESLDALPHGESSEIAGVVESQTELQERLTSEFDDFARGGPPFGVLWITVDQAQDLRKTHGGMACEAMIGKVERVLTQGLRPTEKLGRWGDEEFLVLSHERTPEMLADHAQVLAGLARTADFRWWGDRVSLTVSIGAAQAEQIGTLVGLLDRAKAAMFSSLHQGGNHITAAPGEKICLPL